MTTYEALTQYAKRAKSLADLRRYNRDFCNPPLDDETVEHVWGHHAMARVVDERIAYHRKHADLAESEHWRVYHENEATRWEAMWAPIRRKEARRARH